MDLGLSHGDGIAEAIAADQFLYMDFERRDFNFSIPAFSYKAPNWCGFGFAILDLRCQFSITSFFNQLQHDHDLQVPFLIRQAHYYYWCLTACVQCVLWRRIKPEEHNNMQTCFDLGCEFTF